MQRAEELKLAMSRAGVTQQEVADRLGIKVWHVAKYRQAQSVPDDICSKLQQFALFC